MVLTHLAALGAVAAVLAASSGTAQAATVTVANGELRVAATAPGVNVIDVVPDALGYRIHDSSAAIVAPDCVTVTESEVVCGGTILSVRIDGGGGPDLLGLWDVPIPVTATGGPGNDLIETGAGADTVDAGPGMDTVVAQGGNDTVAAGADRDRVDGGDGDDVLKGDQGADALAGGAGQDALDGGADGDLVDGGAGDDVLAGDGGANTIVATQGTDTITTNSANDSVVSPPQAPQRPRCRASRQSQSLRCDSDRVRANVRRGAAPRSWPPTAAQAVASAAAVSVIPRWAGNAARLTVSLNRSKFASMRVCVFLFDRNERQVGRFPAQVKAPRDSIKSPRPGVYFGRATLQTSGCAPVFRG